MKPIDKLMDCHHVKRWTLVGTVSESTVASHSFNVAVIALAIRKRMYNTIHIDKGMLSYYALMHDVDESETGDMPTPTKAAIRSFGVEPNALFETQGQEAEPPPEYKIIIKLADLIENYIFICEQGVGARARAASIEVEGRMRRAIADAPTDAGTAAAYVLDYITDRKSDSDEERKRIKESSERLREATRFSRDPGSHFVDRESRDKRRVP